MPSAGRIAIRPATIIDGMAPATPMPTPTPNVASRISGTLGATLRAAPNPAISAMHAANASRGPRRAASRGPNGANSPMHRTGIVVSSPAGAAERPRSARISGSSGPMERSCWRSASDATNRPTTTAMGTRGAGDDTPRMLSDVVGPPEPLVRGRVRDPVEEPVEDLAEHRLVGAARWNSVIDERSLTASIPPKMSSAERPCVASTMAAHSRSRGPSTGWARYATASSSDAIA